MAIAAAKELAAKAAKVAADRLAIGKLCDEAVKATPHDLDVSDLASQLKAAADEVAVKAICAEVQARK